MASNIDQYRLINNKYVNLLIIAVNIFGQCNFSGFCKRKKIINIINNNNKKDYLQLTNSIK